MKIKSKILFNEIIIIIIKNINSINSQIKNQLLIENKIKIIKIKL